MTQLSLSLETPITLSNYDATIIAFSGGKDSLACLLWAIEHGAPNIELWHHRIDVETRFMDWPCTEGYCRAIATHFGLPLYMSWLDGGFEKELLRHNRRKPKTYFETPDGLKHAGGIRGKVDNRLKFPQVTANLKTRWCSSSLKIDVGAIAINNQPRFTGGKTLVLSGERAEESANRANYAAMEPDRTHAKKRHVDRLRPVHRWRESEVWDIIRRHRINPHPAYHLGWGRVSCMGCIFGNQNQWASIKAIAPQMFAKIAAYEAAAGLTIHRSRSIEEQAAMGTPYAAIAENPAMVAQAMAEAYHTPIILDPWEYPAGAFGDLTGSL